MRLLRMCHAMAMLLWWLGFVGFAWYVLAPLDYWESGQGIVENLTRPFTRTAPGVIHQIMEEPIIRWGGKELLELYPDTTAKMAVGMVIADNRHPETWLTWYYSPLNIHHWGVAMLCVAPALGMTLLTRHLAWRRQH